MTVEARSAYEFNFFKCASQFFVKVGHIDFSYAKYIYAFGLALLYKIILRINYNVRTSFLFIQKGLGRSVLVVSRYFYFTYHLYLNLYLSNLRPSWLQRLRILWRQSVYSISIVPPKNAFVPLNHPYKLILLYI